MNDMEKNECNFKERVLYEIITLCFENRLNEEKQNIPYKIIPGSKAKYRCCVYKEREIVRQRVQLACGNNLLGDLPENKDNAKKLFHVIDAACEECPISRYIVTENCQSCISKKCKDACPFGAISVQGKKAYIQKDLCKECGKCKDACPFNAIADLMRPCMKSCPVDAINMTDEKKAVINYDKCINCGMCAVQCPFGAISEASSVVQVIKLLKSDVNTFAIIAPSIEGQYKNANLQQIKQALITIGFKGVYEAAYGAELVAKEEALDLDQHCKNQIFMSSSCCPTFVNLIQKHYPNLKETISHSESPMIKTAKLIKARENNPRVVFISPCISKKAEIRNQNNVGLVDYVITFIELDLMFKASQIELGAAISSTNELETSEYKGYGKDFAESGGVSNSINKVINELGLNITMNSIECDGIEECKKNLAIASYRKVSFNFIEGMACKDGCIGGPCCIVPSNISKKFRRLNIPTKSTKNE